MKTARKLTRYLLALCCMLMLWAIPAQAATLGKTQITKISVRSASALDVSWQKVSGASGYELYRKSGSGSFQKVASVAGINQCTYTDGKLKADTLYTYQVKAYRSVSGKKQYGEPSAAKSARTAAEVTAVTLEKIKNIKVGQSVMLRATVLPAKAVERDLTWSSSNPAVASVSANGKIFGVSAGEAVITARTSNGKKAFCKVTVGYTKTSTFDEFAMASVEVIKNYQSAASGARAAANNRFYLRRLIVKSNGRPLDFSKLRAAAVVKSPDNRYMIQFSSAAAAENAYNIIRKWSGIVYVEPDSYVGIAGEGGTKQSASGKNVFNGSTEVEEENAGISAYDASDSGEWSTGSVDLSDTLSALDSSGLSLTNTALDSIQSNSWGVSKIGASAYAKRVRAKTSATIKVAVVDSGVDRSHPFLKSRVTSDGYDYVDDDSNPYDYHGHGTHVSGTIVDCTPGLNVKILPVRVLNAKGEGSSFVVGLGIEYAVNHGAKVINLSLGGGCSRDQEDAINYAVRKGVTVVVASGNEYTNINRAYKGYPTCPAHMKNVICVGAVNSSNRKADFSNYGSTLDVVAPGVSIRSSVPGGYYESWNGTSMATPHVAALAAMVKLANPSYSPAKVESTIKSHCKDLGSKGWDQYYGYGIPNFANVGGGKTIAVTKVSLNKTSVTVKRGSKYTLKATVSPSNATNKKVTWSSANPSVASVSSSGVVLGKRSGTATITAKTSNGKKATCKVKVVNPTPVTKPGAPTVTYRTMDDDGWTYLTWRKVNGANGYRVRCLNYRQNTTTVQHLSGSSNTTWYSWLDENTAYQISICAYKVQNGKRVYGSTRALYMAVPRSVWDSDASPTALTLNWTALRGIHGYRVYASLSRDSGYQLAVTLPAGATAVRFTGLGSEPVYVRIIPYRTVNGKKMNFPYKNITIS